MAEIAYGPEKWGIVVNKPFRPIIALEGLITNLTIIPRQLSWVQAWRFIEPRERLSEVLGWKSFNIDPVSH